MRVALLLSLLSAFCYANEPEWDEIHGNGIYTVSQKGDAGAKAEAFGRSIGSFLQLAKKTDIALDAIYRVGIQNLRRRGYKAEALQLQRDFTNYVDGALERLVSRGVRDIGDFAPLSAKLAIAYEILEMKLGYKTCYFLRLTDIKTLNYAIPVVFHPCTYGEKEFSLHFIHDDKYRGLAPVVSYWTTVIVCSFATYGAGYFFICSPVGMLVELGVDRAVAPWIEPKLYNLACGG